MYTYTHLCGLHKHQLPHMLSRVVLLQVARSKIRQHTHAQLQCIHVCVCVCVCAIYRYMVSKVLHVIVQYIE